MKTRDIKELLILVRDNTKLIGPSFFQIWGLCELSMTLLKTNNINEDEYKMLRKFLKKHRPKKLNGLEFWWPEGLMQPRLDWLNEQIAKL
jgi:hypothetical protein